MWQGRANDVKPRPGRRRCLTNTSSQSKLQETCWTELLTASWSGRFDDRAAMRAPAVAPTGYAGWLTELKTRIRETRLRAALAVNSELIGLYWRIGRDILDRQAQDDWGSKVVDRLAADLRAEFPDARGFSSVNLRYMRAFAEAWPDPETLQRLVGRLPWGQNIELLRVKDGAARLWYAEAALEHGWSRPVLAAQIDTSLRDRQGRAVTNFGRVLPPETSDLARQVLKDPTSSTS